MAKWIAVLAICLSLTAPWPAWSAEGAEAVSGGASEKSNGIYLDFSDILLPRELKVNRDQSFVYDTSSFTAGVLYLEGRVEVKSLTSFFTQAMLRDNWVLAAKFTSPKIVLLFEKPSKRAIIMITDTPLKTQVQIWVAPFLAGGK